MRARDIFLRAGRNLRQAKGRTILTALAIAVGAATITLAMAAGAGGRDYITKQASERGLGSYAVISVSPYVAESSKNNDQVQKYVEPAEKGDFTGKSADHSRQLSPADLTKIGAVKGVKNVYPAYQLTPKYIQRGATEDKYMPPYVDIAELHSVPSNNLRTGAYPTDYKGRAVITEDYAKAFNSTADQLIGKYLYLTFQGESGAVNTFSFEVSGVEKKSFNASAITIGINDAATISRFVTGGDGYVTHATVIPDGSVAVPQLTTNIASEGFSAYSSEESQGQALQALNIAQWGLVGFGAIALLAAIFGIVNTQYISVLERTQQIGLMKAVGASGRDIARLFRYEAAWVGLLGGFIGVAIAYLFSLSSPLLKSLIGAGDTDITLFIFEPLTVISIVALLVIIAVLAGYFPSRKAARLDPIEALRRE